MLLLAPAAFSQSRETGAIRGVITDEQGAPLPGVNVTLSGENLMGVRAFVTDVNGEFRFPALPPGEYEVKAELAGFGAVVREKIRVNTTATLTVDIQLKPAAVTEEVTVVAKSPTVDVKSTETASVTLSNEILQNMPSDLFTALIVNMAPGVNNNSAFGASANTGIAYSMDGVNVADPEAGSSWVFSDHNVIEEAKVMGIGLPAEYGNFTGVIFNLVTKSGGNAFSGHFEAGYQGFSKDSSFWATSNIGAYTADFPELTAPEYRLLDLSAHLGGPIVKDKLWFYVGYQYFKDGDLPTGFPEVSVYKQPRYFAKLTTQLTPSMNVNLAFQRTKYQGTYRGADQTYSPEATVTQDSPDWLISLSLTNILSPKTFFDLKTNYFEGKYYLDPTAGPEPYYHLDLNENWNYGSASYYYYADRSRFGTNASLTHYAEDFLAGSHEFKFGAEVERSMARSRFGYNGQGGPLGDHINYIDYTGEGYFGYIYSGNYLAYQYSGYDTNTRYTRLEMFVQDSWQVGKRLNLSLGLRYSMNWGDIKDVSGTVFKTNRLAPRLGFTFDLLGDKTTILKAHYGHFTEAMLTVYHDRMNPVENFGDNIGYYFVPDDDDPNTDTGTWELWYTISANAYQMDPNIKHPYMAQWTVGIERELFKDASLGLTYINRKWKDMIGRYNRAAVYEEASWYSPELDETFTVYERTLDSLEESDFYITNLRKSTEYPNILTDVYRNYEGIEVLFNKRFSNRWQLLASYVYGKATGTRDNSFGSDVNASWSADPGDPNNYIETLGNLTNDPTHMFKLQGTYVLPFAINFNAYFRAITGNAWTTRIRTDGAAFNQGQITFFAEPRGTNHYPMRKILDLRIEKIFTLAGKYRLGFLVDVFNVFNADTITSWGTRIGYDWFPGDYPSTDGHEAPNIVLPRQARLGVRLIF